MKDWSFARYGLLLSVCSVMFLFSGSLYGQYKGSPVKKEKLISVLKSRQLQTREIVNVIKTNGVDFTLSKDTELELYTAGARPEVIAAAKANYRAAAAPVKGPISKFTGQPLSKDAIITALSPVVCLGWACALARAMPASRLFCRFCSANTL